MPRAAMRITLRAALFGLRLGLGGPAMAGGAARCWHRSGAAFEAHAIGDLACWSDQPSERSQHGRAEGCLHLRTKTGRVARRSVKLKRTACKPHNGGNQTTRIQVDALTRSAHALAGLAALVPGGSRTALTPCCTMLNVLADRF
eukprot:scaffold18776_cov140-Isochrysis_galbana.AAC.2